MGASLPKAVDATVVERHGTKSFQVGIAEMNGWRNSMEDAHVIIPKDDWGFFGVFDGHGGGACSEFVAKRFYEELRDKECECPPDDAAMKKLVLGIDQEFLDLAKPSGSTATMCIVRKPKAAGAKHLLHVINAGDSRVLLGRMDGTIVDGGGTDEGLTVDHKPDYPSERERIYRCGGTVEHEEGNCARVNGDLAVSRGFGDREYKKTGGPAPEDRPVTADPEMGHFECDEGDFLLLVCDGVSEGNFPNQEVVEFVAGLLREGTETGLAARAVCHKAVERNSKDNVTCMIVLFTPAEAEIDSVEFYPGPITNLGHKGFQTAYEAMAAKAGLSLAKAAERRYEALQQLLAEAPTQALREEADFIGSPPKEDRTQWFESWLKELPEEKNSGPGGMDMEALMNAKGGGTKGSGKGGGGSKGSGKSQVEAVEDEEVEKDEDGYTWSQKGEEVQIAFKLDKAASKKDIKVNFKSASLNVVVHGSPLLDGALGGKVEVEDCTWCLASGGSELQLMLTKKNASDTWKNLLQ